MERKSIMIQGLTDPKASQVNEYKCLESIITYRLYGFVEHFKTLDKEQAGFTQFRGTSDALLRLSQDIFNGFNSKEHTAALFIFSQKGQQLST